MIFYPPDESNGGAYAPARGRELSDGSAEGDFEAAGLVAIAAANMNWYTAKCHRPVQGLLRRLRNRSRL